MGLKNLMPLVVDAIGFIITDENMNVDEIAKAINGISIVINDRQRGIIIPLSRLPMLPWFNGPKDGPPVTNSTDQLVTPKSEASGE